MAKNVEVIPFTEIVERVGDLARERVDSRSKVRGVVNDFYVREFARKWDWNFFMANSTLSVQGRYNTGTVSATTGSTTVTFTGAALTQSNNLWQLSIQGADFIYTLTYVSSSSGTLNVPFGGTQNITNGSFSLYQPFYSLASNFDRFPKNGGLINYQGGQQSVIQERPFQEWDEFFNPTPSLNASDCRIYGMDTAGNQILELTPPPLNNINYRYDYFIRPTVMRQTTGGKIALVANGGTAVTGDASTQFSVANTGDYFRIDALGTGADSEWYRIISISGNSGLTLQTAFQNTGNASVTSANYTICSAPQMPYNMHPAILYGAILQLCVDQNDPMVQVYNTKFAEVLSDGKRLYVSRIYNQEVHHIGEDWMYRR